MFILYNKYGIVGCMYIDNKAVYISGTCTCVCVRMCIVLKQNNMYVCYI